MLSHFLRFLLALRFQGESALAQKKAQVSAFALQVSVKYAGFEP